MSLSFVYVFLFWRGGREGGKGVTVMSSVIWECVSSFQFDGQVIGLAMLLHGASDKKTAGGLFPQRLRIFVYFVPLNKCVTEDCY